MIVCFSERSGGVSAAPWHGLNLAAHVGDVPERVDENRSRLLAALGIGGLRERLVTAEQVHGASADIVEEIDAGRGAWAAGGRPSLERCDALVTSAPDIPLLMCFADCVPVVLVAPGPVVACVHVGWRGALAGVLDAALAGVLRLCGAAADSVSAYVGAHIGPCHYEVGAEVMSRFVGRFGAGVRAGSGLDLGAVVETVLVRAGVDPDRIARLGACTAESTDRFFSHRAEGGLTGRHGALVCLAGR